MIYRYSLIWFSAFNFDICEKINIVVNLSIKNTSSFWYKVYFQIAEPSHYVSLQPSYKMQNRFERARAL